LIPLKQKEGALGEPWFPQILMSRYNKMEICTLQITTYGILGSLLIISEILGIVPHVKANSIIHFVYLTLKHLVSKPNIDTLTVLESLEEALIDEGKESDKNTIK